MNDVFSITLLSHWFTMCSPYVSKDWNSGRGGNFQNRRGAPFLSFIAFLCDNFKNYPNFGLPQGGRGWGLRGLRGGDHPPLPPMDTYGVVSISLWWANFFLGSSLTLKVENAFFSALYYSIITTVLWKKGRGQDSYFSTKSDEKINGLWKAQLYIHFFVSK